MAARSHDRGWPIEHDGERWIYSDTKELVDGQRECRRCGVPPTPEGYDACTGHVAGKDSVCCGHGVHEVISL